MSESSGRRRAAAAEEQQEQRDGSAAATLLLLGSGPAPADEADETPPKPRSFASPAKRVPSEMTAAEKSFPPVDPGWTSRKWMRSSLELFKPEQEVVVRWDTYGDEGCLPAVVHRLRRECAQG